MRRDGWIEFSEDPRERGDAEDVILVWHIYQGVMTVRRGLTRGNRFYTHWREIDVNAWIGRGTRLPEAEDADAQNCVIVRRESGICVAGWRRLHKERDMEAWQRPPAPPGEWKELLNRELTEALWNIMN